MTEEEPKYIKLFRFLNLLDDSKPMLSPTKFNTWLATLSAIGAALATMIGFIIGHMTGIEALWGGSMAWISQAFIAHHTNKKERNLQKLRLKE